MKKGLIGAIAGLVGLMVYFVWQGIEQKSLANERQREIYRLEWELAKDRAERDTISIPGEYRVDTLWVPDTVVKIHPRTGEVDTVYRDKPGPVFGEISLDTTAYFKGSDWTLSVRTYGRLYYPQEFAHRNRMLIIPDLNPPFVPSDAKKPKMWGLGMGIGFYSSQWPSVAVLGHRGRISLSVSRRIDRNLWGGGIGYEILQF